MAIRFIVDGASDMDREYAAANNIIIIPLRLFFGEEEFFEGVNMTNQEFYAKLETGKALPKTSLINQFTWEEAFKAGLAAGDQIVAVTLSEKLSGTYQQAKLAQAEINSPDIFVMDSVQVSFSITALVIEGVKMAQAGKSAEEIYKHLEELKHKVRIFGVIHSLKYLKEGGRLSNAAAFVGSIINLKPVVSVVNGVVANVGKTIGFKKGLQTIMEKLRDENYDETMPVYFGDGASRDMLLEFIEMVKKNFKIISDRIFNIGPAIGTYSGPGVIGIAFFKK
ncbi:MAG: DegV family protein [Firmicutes bacterium]|nr:DegV family protein [Bacillota bacterium]